MRNFPQVRGTMLHCHKIRRLDVDFKSFFL